ncbi:MAG: MFS transporter [Acidovorax sp.]|jgi:EmrB/QacA subfamily drug resistance transporter|nr:MFS transporter [Acidovorax sp.]
MTSSSIDSLSLTDQKVFKRRCAVAAAYLGTFLATLDISIVNVALPTLQQALHTDIAGLQWVVNAYAICLSAFMLSAGPVADRYGHKRAWICGVVLFTIGSALCAAASSINPLLAGRALQGLAGALVIPGALPILAHAYPDPKQRAHVIGGWSAFSALALVLGPLLGGVLLHFWTWHSIFLINLPLGVLAVALGIWGITERKHPQEAALDPAGQLLSVLFLGALTYGLIEAGESSFTAAPAMAALGLALLAAVLFVFTELKVKRPLVPLEMFRQPQLALTNLASFVLGFSYYSSLFFFSIFLQGVQSWSPVEAGWRMMPLFVVTGLTSVLFGKLSARFSLHRLMVTGYARTSLSMAAMAWFTVSTPYKLVGAFFVLMGLGVGLAVPATGIAVMENAPPTRAGMVSAMLNALRQMGMTVGIALLGALMTHRAIQVMASSPELQEVAGAADLANQAITHHVVPESLSALYASSLGSGFQVAMLVAALVCGAATALLVSMKRAA